MQCICTLKLFCFALLATGEAQNQPEKSMWYRQFKNTKIDNPYVEKHDGTGFFLETINLDNAEFAYKDGVYYCLAKCSDKQDEQKIKDQCRVVMIHQVDKDTLHCHLYSFMLTEFKIEQRKFLKYDDNKHLFAAQGKLIWNTVTVTELSPWWDGPSWMSDGRYFTFDSDEFEIVLGPVVKWIEDTYNKLNRVLQRDKDGNKKRCAVIYAQQNPQKTKISGRWEWGGSKGDWAIGDTVEAVIDCCQHFEEMCCRGGGSCCGTLPDYEKQNCGEGEGDCDYDYECMPGYICGDDNCDWGGSDCCTKANP